MNEFRMLALLLAAAVVFGGCSARPEPPAVTPLGYPAEPTEAQPKLATTKLWLGAEQLVAELALAPREQQTGMMFRTNMTENEAMLFVFAGPHRASFWMRNTPLPLSAAYIDPEGVILEIRSLEPYNTNSVEAATDRVQYVLETRQGWFQRHNISTGVVVRTERGSLRDTFFRR